MGSIAKAYTAYMRISASVFIHRVFIHRVFIHTVPIPPFFWIFLKRHKKYKKRGGMGISLKKNLIKSIRI